MSVAGAYLVLLQAPLPEAIATTRHAIADTVLLHPKIVFSGRDWLDLRKGSLQKAETASGLGGGGAL